MTSIKEVSREKAHTDASDTVRVDFPFSRRIASDCGRTRSATDAMLDHSRYAPARGASTPW